MAFTNAARAVVARLFRLVNTTGQVTAELEPLDVTYGIGNVGSQLQMLHLDTTENDSALAWTQNPDGTGQYVILAGPTGVGLSSVGAPKVILADVPGHHVASVNSGRAAIGDTKQSSLDLRSDDVSDMSTATLTTGAGLKEHVSVTLTAADLGPSTSSIVLQAYVNGGAVPANITSINVSHNNPGIVATCDDFNVNARDDIALTAADRIDISGVTAVNLAPGAAGRLQLGGRNGFLPLSLSNQKALPGNVVVPNVITFVYAAGGGGITVNNCVVGDVIRIAVDGVFVVNATGLGGIVFVSIQGYLGGIPTGLLNVIDGVAVAAGNYVAVCHVVEFTVPTAGNWEFTMTGQTNGAGVNITFIAGYTVLHVEHWGIR